MEVVELSGDPFEVAHQLGKKRSAVIARRVDYWNRLLARVYRGKKDRLRSLERGFLAAARAVPRYLGEVRALAEGAGLPFADLFRLNLTELQAYADKCTTLVLPFETPRGPGILIAHNEDWDPRRNDVFVLKARLPECAYAILAYDGYLPGLSSGVNSFGLGHAINYLAPPDRRVGVPRIFITRHLVTARNFEDVVNWAKRHARAFGQGIHLAQGSQYLGLELTSKKVAFWRPRLPAVHANHYLDAGLRRSAPPPGISSLARYHAAKALLDEEARRRREAWTRTEAVRAARRILSDRSGLPYAVWREADSTDETGATVACALIDTGHLTLEVFRKRPDETSPGMSLLTQTRWRSTSRRRSSRGGPCSRRNSGPR